MKYFSNLIDLKKFVLTFSTSIDPPPQVLMIDDLGDMVDLPSAPEMEDHHMTSSPSRGYGGSEKTTPLMRLLELLTFVNHSLLSTSSQSLFFFSISSTNTPQDFGNPHDNIWNRFSDINLRLVREDDDDEGDVVQLIHDQIPSSSLSIETTSLLTLHIPSHQSSNSQSGIYCSEISMELIEVGLRKQEDQKENDDISTIISSPTFISSSPHLNSPLPTNITMNEEEKEEGEMVIGKEEVK